MSNNCDRKGIMVYAVKTPIRTYHAIKTYTCRHIATKAFI